MNVGRVRTCRCLDKQQFYAAEHLANLQHPILGSFASATSTFLPTYIHPPQSADIVILETLRGASSDQVALVPWSRRLRCLLR